MYSNTSNNTTFVENLLELQAQFSNSNLPIVVDVQDWVLIPEVFRKEIPKNYAIIQSA